METPNTPSGELTERIMAAITERIGKLPVQQYNAVYSAVLCTLEEDRRLDAGTLQAFKAAVDGSKWPNEKAKAIPPHRFDVERTVEDILRRNA
jgi:hypothetical protein